MDAIEIEGGAKLSGSVTISGAKNSALKLICASLLSADPITITRLPELADVKTLLSLIGQMGVAVERGEGQVTLTASEGLDTTAPYDLVRKMRASIIVLGPLLARCGRARVSLPGGCAIGNRPVDIHLKGLEGLGAQIKLEGGYVEAIAPAGGLTGARLLLDFPSVGATENLMMAATLAKGETVIANAAREPEITDLGRMLIAMGANIEGLGTDRITVEGVESLHGCTHATMTDRIEAGTYALAAAITGGSVRLDGAVWTHNEALWSAMRKAGIKVERAEDGDAVLVDASTAPLIGTDVMTEPYPGFPTDLQAQFMAAMSVADGAAMVTETIFENRFMHVPELARMGANVTVHGSSALVRGMPGELTGAPVMATDLRASSSLILAGLAAKGTTQINRVYHLDRGYERLEEKFSALGATIRRVAA
ncbi:MAG: UDP-N-acetylglucosamine 1-carboxyvinyltransferase [Alphaproteobacteria bacterium]